MSDGLAALRAAARERGEDWAAYYAVLADLPAREGPPICPGCGRVMSRREAAEQAACNDCHGGAW